MGKINAATVTPGTIVGTDISLTAGIRAESMYHTFVQKTTFGQPPTGTPVSLTEQIYVANGPVTIMGFHGMVRTPGSAASVTLDLKKNGTTVLSSVITLTNSSVGGTVYNATLSTITGVAGDIFDAVLTVSTSTGMQGVSCWMTIQEQNSPV